MYSNDENDDFDFSKEFIYNATDANSTQLKEILSEIKRCKFYGDIKWPVNIDQDSNKKLMDEIKAQLKANNNEFTRFPNDFTHALLSRHVYGFMRLTEKFKVEIEGCTQFNDEEWRVHRIFQSQSSNPKYQRISFI